MDPLTDAIREAHIEMLRKQNAELLEENIVLKRELQAWPVRCLEHALKLRLAFVAGGGPG